MAPPHDRRQRSQDIHRMTAIPIRGLRWWLISLVMVGSVINYLTRSTLAVAGVCGWPFQHRRFSRLHARASARRFCLLLFQLADGLCSDWHHRSGLGLPLALLLLLP